MDGRDWEREFQDAIVNTIRICDGDAAYIRTHEDHRGFGTYWVVEGQDRRNVVLTDDSEGYLIWVEGTMAVRGNVQRPGRRPLVDLVARIVTWFTEICRPGMPFWPGLS